MLHLLSQASSWLCLSKSEWKLILSPSPSPSSSSLVASVGTSGHASSSQLRSSHPLSQMCSYLSIERRKVILLWQRDLFDSLCQQVYQRDVIAITSPSSLSPRHSLPPSSSSQRGAHPHGNDDNGEDEVKEENPVHQEQEEIVFSVIGSFTKDRQKTLENTMKASVASIFKPLVEFHSLLNHLQDHFTSSSSTPAAAGGGGAGNGKSELSELFRSDPMSRNIMETLRVLSWLTASTSESIPEDEFSQVDTSLTMLQKMTIASHCNLPLELREKILSSTLRCLSLSSEKYLYLCLNRSSDGTLRENCGRRQMFIDLAGAFSELSLLLADMYRQGLIQAEAGTGAGGSKDKAEVEVGRLMGDGETKTAHEYVNHLVFGKHETGGMEQQQQIEQQIAHRNDLVSTARWVLKLEMAILTEDWDRMDLLSSTEKPNISLPQCPGIIEVVNSLLSCFLPLTSLFSLFSVLFRVSVLSVKISKLTIRCSPSLFLFFSLSSLSLS
jgi:hypothetical protein